MWRLVNQLTYTVEQSIIDKSDLLIIVGFLFNKELIVARTRKLPSQEKRSPKLKKPSFIGKFARRISTLLLKALRPLGFILRPFKLKPVRFVGRMLSKVLLLGYFKASWQELRQVSWPDRKETTKLTFAVFIFAVGFGLLIAATDYGITKIFEEVIL